jgi:putative ABC transport system substrate-binding protein
MNRRTIITLLGGAAAAWPSAARAQQPERMQRVGVLMNLAADDPEASARVTAFAQGLQQSGWTVGHNVRIDYRWGAFDADRSGRYAAELLALAPDILLATSPPTVVRLPEWENYIEVQWRNPNARNWQTTCAVSIFALP